MADYGLTDQGFNLPRLEDLLTAQRQRAVTIFQDLVAPGDVVDTSPSSLLGRLIAIDAAGDADLWEVAQLLYSAFDPNSATGVALDNLVQYAGIEREGDSYSTVSGLFAGSTGTLISSGSVVSDVNTNNQFEVVSSVALSPTNCAGVTLTIQSVANSTNYSLTYITSSGSSVITYTSDADATLSEILTGLQSLIASSHPLLTASVVGSTLVVNRVDVFQTSTFSVTNNLAISKVRKVGDLQAVEVGPVEQEANTIQTIVTPVLGWDSITNPLAASPGRLRETDEELRLRFRSTKLERSNNILDSLYSALLSVEGVEEVAIYENDTNVTDSNGVLAHSFLPVVLGGSSQQIAEAIWLNKPAGILSQGNTTISILDSQGFAHNISFDRPIPVTIYVEVNISIDPESDVSFPGDGADQIKAAIIEYAGNNFGVGKDVIYSRLFTPINTVSGHQVDSLYIGTSPSPVGTSNLVIDFNELSSFETANIVVNVA